MKARAPKPYESHKAAQTKAVEGDGISAGTNQMEKRSDVPSQLGTFG